MSFVLVAVCGRAHLWLIGKHVLVAQDGSRGKHFSVVLLEEEWQRLGEESYDCRCASEM